jgi:hypothetical protein
MILLKALSTFTYEGSDIEALGRYVNLVNCLLKVEWQIEDRRNKVVDDNVELTLRNF